MDFRRLKRLTFTAGASVIAILVAACGSTPSAATSPSPTVTVPSDLSISSFTSDFSYMANLKSLVTAGSGMVGVILPDTTSSARYVAFDQPYLTQAFTDAGYSSSQFKIDNAQGVEAQELQIAQADITAGATVLIMDPLNSTVGSQIQTLAASKGVKLISYDRATFTGTNTYYVSFDNVQVGKLIGQGFLDCVTSWGVKTPQVFTLNGGENSDPNAVSFAMGYNSVVWGDSVPQETVGKTNSQGMKLVGDQVATNWTNSIGGTIFQQAFTANKNINATIEANDGLAGAVIQVLKNKGVKAKSIPDHRTGRNPGRDGQRAGRLPVRVGLQGRLPRGAGRRRPGDSASRGSDASNRVGERHHDPSIRGHGQPAASHPPRPRVGQRGQHGNNSDQGQVRRRHHALQQGRSRRLHPPPARLVTSQMNDAAAARGGVTFIFTVLDNAG